LVQVLKDFPLISDDNLLVGIDTADDAAVYRLNESLALVFTVDFITPVVDDPYTFGAVAAANSLSDVYAMGARPLMALNVIGFPVKSLSLDILVDILRGGNDKAGEAGINIVGGHTVDDHELKYGMAVIGLVDPGSVVTNCDVREGDALILTKPLGIGIITTAIKAGMTAKKTREKAVKAMLTLNKTAAEAMLEAGAHACTDVTGFGLLGHLHEMVAGNGMGAVINLRKVPVLTEAWGLIEKGVASEGTHSNREFLKNHVEWDSKISREAQLVLCDPQTSGGLLVSIPKAKKTGYLKSLREGGIVRAAHIGDVVADEKGKIYVRP
jgi:selenide,water dikinase